MQISTTTLQKASKQELTRISKLRIETERITNSSLVKEGLHHKINRADESTVRTFNSILATENSNEDKYLGFLDYLNDAEKYLDSHQVKAVREGLQESASSEDADMMIYNKGNIICRDGLYRDDQNQIIKLGLGSSKNAEDVISIRNINKVANGEILQLLPSGHIIKGEILKSDIKEENYTIDTNKTVLWSPKTGTEFEGLVAIDTDEAVDSKERIKAKNGTFYETNNEGNLFSWKFPIKDGLVEGKQYSNSQEIESEGFYKRQGTKNILVSGTRNIKISNNEKAISVTGKWSNTNLIKGENYKISLPNIKSPITAIYNGKNFDIQDKEIYLEGNLIFKGSLELDSEEYILKPINGELIFKKDFNNVKFSYKDQSLNQKYSISIGENEALSFENSGSTKKTLNNIDFSTANTDLKNNIENTIRIASSVQEALGKFKLVKPKDLREIADQNKAKSHPEISNIILKNVDDILLATKYQKGEENTRKNYTSYPIGSAKIEIHNLTNDVKEYRIKDTNTLMVFKLKSKEKFPTRIFIEENNEKTFYLAPRSDDSKLIFAEGKLRDNEITKKALKLNAFVDQDYYSKGLNASIIIDQGNTPHIIGETKQYASNNEVKKVTFDQNGNLISSINDIETKEIDIAAYQKQKKTQKNLVKALALLAVSMGGILYTKADSSLILESNKYDISTTNSLLFDNSLTDKQRKLLADYAYYLITELLTDKLSYLALNRLLSQNSQMKKEKNDVNKKEGSDHDEFIQLIENSNLKGDLKEQYIELSKEHQKLGQQIQEIDKTTQDVIKQTKGFIEYIKLKHEKAIKEEKEIYQQLSKLSSREKDYFNLKLLSYLSTVKRKSIYLDIDSNNLFTINTANKGGTEKQKKTEAILQSFTKVLFKVIKSKQNQVQPPVILKSPEDLKLDIKAFND